MTISDSTRQLIIDYLDGNLSPDEIEKVEVLLSTDPDIYNEYKILKAITSTASQCSSSFEPSEKVTAKIFEAVGITSPLPATTRNVTATSGVFFASLYKFALPVFASIAIFLATTFPTSNNQIAENSVSPVENITTIAKASVADFSPLKTAKKFYARKNILKANKNSLPPISSSTFAEENYITNENDLFAYDEQNEESDYFAENEGNYNYNNVPYTSVHYSAEPLATSFTPTLSSSSRFELPRLNPERYSSINSFAGDIGLVVELKSSSYLAADNRDADTRLKNIGVTVLSRVSKNVFVGFDVRNESFEVQNDQIQSAKAAKILNAGISTTNEVKDVNLTSVGVTVRYCARQGFRDRLYPNGEISLAKNRKGSVGRAGISLCYAPTDGLTATVGIEYSDLSYQYDNSSSFNSSKFGLNYGISYNF